MVLEHFVYSSHRLPRNQEPRSNRKPLIAVLATLCPTQAAWVLAGGMNTTTLKAAVKCKNLIAASKNACLYLHGCMYCRLIPVIETALDGLDKSGMMHKTYIYKSR